MEKTVVVREEKRALRMSREGLCLGLGRVRKDKTRVLNIERVHRLNSLYRTCYPA